MRRFGALLLVSIAGVCANAGNAMCQFQNPFDQKPLHNSLLDPRTLLHPPGRPRPPETHFTPAVMVVKVSNGADFYQNANGVFIERNNGNYVGTWNTVSTSKDGIVIRDAKRGFDIFLPYGKGDVLYCGTGTNDWSSIGDGRWVDVSAK